MDNYEINILRRGGHWKKVKPDDLIPDDLIIDEIDEENKIDKLSNQDLNYNFLHSIDKINSIILRLETLEGEKNSLKEKLKTYEDEFSKKKKIAEEKINKISQEKEIIIKTINIIKNLKSF